MKNAYTDRGIAINEIYKAFNEADAWRKIMLVIEPELNFVEENARLTEMWRLYHEIIGKEI